MQMNVVCLHLVYICMLEATKRQYFVGVLRKGLGSVLQTKHKRDRMEVEAEKRQEREEG